MRTLYIEGLANHDGPESCVGDPRGRSEAWTGVRAGPAIELRNQGFGVPTPLTRSEGKIAGRAIASGRRTPRSRRTGACTESPGARTGRSGTRPRSLMMPRPGRFAGWHVGGLRAAGGTLRR